MGRPLNPRYFGIPRGQGVFVPITNLHGNCQASLIVNQTNKHTYLCKQLETGYQGVCKLSNNLHSQGSMIIRFLDHTDVMQYASKITNLFVWDFHGNKYMWSFWPNLNHLQTHVLVIDNSNYHK